MQQQICDRSGVVDFHRVAAHGEMRRGNHGIRFPQQLALTAVLCCLRRFGQQLFGSDVVLQVAAKQIQDPLGQLLKSSKRI